MWYKDALVMGEGHVTCHVGQIKGALRGGQLFVLTKSKRTYQTL